MDFQMFENSVLDTAKQYFNAVDGHSKRKICMDTIQGSWGSGLSVQKAAQRVIEGTLYGDVE